ncbi:Nif3-like dinuclear metal center hexameric protein [Canibacter zhoujuaniae]|uniref:Nif3-like dinuclear metal center hexameric protein n=1 Tax=Canibacter zhoujuaniae TaxID=2708343 RepID=UPI00141DB113|nr:Nif3-like dinuclear metal center hexameric protein [Canibacter zhoujuaniae]
MAVKLSTIRAFLEELYPLDWAEDWDRVGLVAGDPDQTISHIRLAVDPTVAEANAAAQNTGTLLLTHHPLLLRPVSFLTTETGKGAVITKLIQSRGALWCGHTNSDRSRAGTVGAWIDALQLKNAAPLVAPQTNEPVGDSKLFGMGVVADLPAKTTVVGLARQIADIVPATAQGVLYTGSGDREVGRIAVCPGAGDSLLETVSQLDVDAYITSDLRHHPALEHIESRANALAVPALLDLPHYASEFIYLESLAKMLRSEFPTVTTEVSAISSNPFTGRVDKSVN